MSVSKLLGLAVLLAVVAGGRRADAYPQFQLSQGADTCKQCHFSPGGGGLLDDYGRDATTDLSMWAKGEGTFLHGAWTPPDSFQLGGDFRFMTIVADKPDTDTSVEPIPMQAELYLRPKIGPLSLYAAAGVMPAREGKIQPSARELYAMYESEAGNWYVRAGRFYPIYGVRSQDHTSVVRRDLQMYLWEEPYGVAFGKYFASSELHVSAFARGPGDLPVLATAAHDSGVALYYERRNAESTGAWAAQTRLTMSDTDRRAWVGGVYKRWVEGSKLMILGEADVGVQAFPEVTGMGTPAPLYEAIGYLNAMYFAKQGLMLGTTVQHFDPDLQHHGTARDSLDLDAQWLPIPHLEVQVVARGALEALDVGRPILEMLAQVHYYL